MKPLVDFIVPTFNNSAILSSMAGSLFLSLTGNPLRGSVRLIIVNNGSKGSLAGFGNGKNILVIEPGDNLGWEGGLKAGLAVSEAQFVCFANDDIRFVEGQKDWLWRMLSVFNDKRVGATGPVSNFVMGRQSIFFDNSWRAIYAPYLIGFMLLLRRSALDAAGGVDDGLPGGDDIDLSMRLKKAGYMLVCLRDVFVYHHGTVTGTAVHGGEWNSRSMHERTYNALIRKHGMREFWRTMIMSRVEPPQGYNPARYAQSDTEGEFIRQRIKRGGNILELGCGGKRTVPEAVGVDILASGEDAPYTGGEKVSSDLTADVSVSLPVKKGKTDAIIARHVLEHCHDTIGTLSVWNGALRHGGKLFIAVPNHDLGNTVLLNPDHVAAFTPTSLCNAAYAAGFDLVDRCDDVNGTSMVCEFEKQRTPVVLLDPVATKSPIGAMLEKVAA